MSSSHVESQPTAPPRTEEVSQGIFAYIQPDGSWFLNNTGFLVGREGVVSIDTTSTESRTRDYLAAVGRVTNRAIRTLINTLTTAITPMATACCRWRRSSAIRSAEPKCSVRRSRRRLVSGPM
jgi:hypothetical protein